MDSPSHGLHHSPSAIIAAIDLCQTAALVFTSAAFFFTHHIYTQTTNLPWHLSPAIIATIDLCQTATLVFTSAALSLTTYIFRPQICLSLSLLLILPPSTYARSHHFFSSVSHYSVHLFKVHIAFRRTFKLYCHHHISLHLLSDHFFCPAIYLVLLLSPSTYAFPQRCSSLVLLVAIDLFGLDLFTVKDVGRAPRAISHTEILVTPLIVTCCSLTSALDPSHYQYFYKNVNWCIYAVCHSYNYKCRTQFWWI